MYPLGRGLPVQMFPSQSPLGATDRSMMLYRQVPNSHPQIQQLYYPVMHNHPHLVSIIPSLEQHQYERAQQLQHWKNDLPPDMISSLSEDNSTESPNPLLFFSEVVRSPVSSPPEYILLLSNVPAGLGADQIHDTFEVFGKIVYCRMLLNSAPINDCKYAHSPDCCVIVFKSPEAVKVASSYNELIILGKPVYLHSIDANGVRLANLKSAAGDVNYTEPAQSQPMEESEEKEIHASKPLSDDQNNIDTKEPVTIEYTFEELNNEQKIEAHINESNSSMDISPIDEGVLEAKSMESDFESNGRNSKKKVRPKVLKSSHTRDEPSAESKVKRDNTSMIAQIPIGNSPQKSSRQSAHKKKKNMQENNAGVVGNVDISPVRKGNTVQNKSKSKKIAKKAQQESLKKAQQDIITRNTGTRINKDGSNKVESKDANSSQTQNRRSSADKLRVVNVRKQGTIGRRKNKLKGKLGDKKSRKDKTEMQRSFIDNMGKTTKMARKLSANVSNDFESQRPTIEHGTMRNKSAKATSKIITKQSKSKSFIETSPVKNKRNTARDISPHESPKPKTKNVRKSSTKRRTSEAEVEKKKKAASKRSPGKLVFGSTEDCDYVDSSALKGRYVFSGKKTAASNSNRTQYKRNQSSTSSHLNSCDVTEGKLQIAGRMGTHSQQRKPQNRKKGRKIMIF